MFQKYILGHKFIYVCTSRGVGGINAPEHLNLAGSTNKNKKLDLLKARVQK